MRSFYGGVEETILITKFKKYKIELFNVNFISLTLNGLINSILFRILGCSTNISPRGANA